MSLHIEPITRQIIKINADSQDELGASFLRFQEFYESPEFKGKVFTLGQFRQWYAKEYGAFTYTKDWTGFNIPSYVLKPFIDGLFDPLTEAEQYMVNLFKDREDRFYIIGSQDGSDVLEHEICHALFYVNEKYRDEVTKLINSNKKKLKPVFDWVASKMYHESVHLDEVHAYMSADAKWLESKGVNVDIEIHKKLRKIREKHFNE